MPLFQKRHYVALAETLHRASATHEVPLGYFIAMLEDDNPNFDTERFRLAVETGKSIGKAIRGGPAMPYYRGGNRLMRR